MTQAINKLAYIFEKLSERVRVAVEYEGYESGLGPEELYDAYASQNSLTAFAELKEKVKAAERNPDAEIDVVSLLQKLKAIEDEIKRYARMLADDADRGCVDIQTVSDDHFNKLAKTFEKRNKAKLNVVSPSFWF